MSEIKLKPCPFCEGGARIIGAVGTVFLGEVYRVRSGNAE